MRLTNRSGPLLKRDSLFTISLIRTTHQFSLLMFVNKQSLSTHLILLIYWILTRFLIFVNDFSEISDNIFILQISL